MKFECDKLNVFRELSNIGSGNASSSLAIMLNEIVDIGVPKSDINKFLDITNRYNSPNEKVLGTVLQLSGDMEGFVMVTMNIDSGLNLLSKLSGTENTFKADDYDSMCEELSSMGEICNILCGTYLTAISDMTNSTINPSVPYFKVDEIGNIVNTAESLYSENSDSILCIETDFFTLDSKIEGKYYFIPKLDSCKKLLASLGLSD